MRIWKTQKTRRRTGQISVKDAANVNLAEKQAENHHKLLSIRFVLIIIKEDFELQD
jgi:hypothetical protein